MVKDEKRLWGELNSCLKCKLDNCGGLKGLFGRCKDILDVMGNIIGGRGENLGKKGAEGVGVRGMSEVLSGKSSKCDSVVDFLGDTRVDGGNFDSFCKCLEAISKLPRGGFLWIGSSALSKHTQELCGEAGERLKKLYAVNKISRCYRKYLLGKELRKQEELEEQSEKDSNQSKAEPEKDGKGVNNSNSSEEPHVDVVGQIWGNCPDQSNDKIDIRKPSGDSGVGDNNKSKINGNQPGMVNGMSGEEVSARLREKARKLRKKLIEEKKANLLDKLFKAVEHKYTAGEFNFPVVIEGELEHLGQKRKYYSEFKFKKGEECYTFCVYAPKATKSKVVKSFKIVKGNDEIGKLKRIEGIEEFTEIAQVKNIKDEEGNHVSGFDNRLIVEKLGQYSDNGTKEIIIK